MYNFGVIVAYDCKSNKIRQAISKICQDYNLNRIQYSLFSGAISNTAYKNLLDRIKALPMKSPISILIQKLPIGTAKNFELIEHDAEKLRRFNSFRRESVI
jgi:CRISPR-associated endonuclease Cas2